MEEHFEQEHIHTAMHNHPDKQGEIADIFSDNSEYMKKHNIEAFVKLAKRYYGSEKAVDYSRYIEENADTEEEKKSGSTEYLYALIQYEGKDFLVHVGTGEFVPEVFTRRDIPQFAGFSHSPLPLFVVTSWAKTEYQREEKGEKHKDNVIRRFLDEHAVIYSPKGGQAESRSTSKEREQGINYGNSNGIMEYSDALLALQNAQIHKTFPNTKSFDDFVGKMKELKAYTPEKLKIRSNIKEEFLGQDDEKKIFYGKILDCLQHLSNGNQKNMYKLIQSFDISSQAFVKPSYKKNKN